MALYRRAAIKMNPLHKKILKVMVLSVVVITLTIVLRIFVMDIYKVESASMEKELSVGDFIVVNKLKYGARMPVCPADIPFLQAVSYTLGFRSWAKNAHWNYHRLPGLTNVQRNDIIIFNHPQSGVPVVKRCVGLPGDIVSIEHNNRYANHVLQEEPPTVMYSFCVKSKAGFLSADTLAAYGLQPESILWRWQQYYHLSMTMAAAAGLRRCPLIDTIYKDDYARDAPGPALFPCSPYYRFSRENYGPLKVPAKNMTILLSRGNIDMYRRLIEDYEGNSVKIDGQQIFINGVPSVEYRFKMNYFFVLGDNRYNSIDSRYWGFLPEYLLLGGR